MFRASLLAVTLLAVSSSVAHAGGYLGLGVGTSPSLNDDAKMEPDGRSAKILGGQRWANVSVEGSIGGFDLGVSNSRAESTMYQAQVSGKLSLPLGSNFEAFGRAGLQHAWLSTDNSMNDLSGNGYLLGAGFEYRLKLAVASGSIFVDYTYAKAGLENDRNKVDVSTRMWTLGIIVGI